MIEVITFIVTVAIIATFMGWCLDWAFSGTINPIYVTDYGPEVEYEYSTIICRVCSHEVRYIVQKMEADGEVKCDQCGSFLTKEH